ncbi:HPP family protein [Halopseudomonas xinjiangensis]|uniref:HPP family protein n=1 Tax=Halopseudomonas xinjiangensis TaxID=487184 RepID=A0A1H1TUH1_9GAMM|nr:HPP family protein [Halopseudomonas xinjiangensis]SDS63751.1 HPP family protein [Halopseudomonas xinjiangensis]
MARRWWGRALRFMGWRPDNTTHQEKLISALGATLSLLLVYWVTHLGLAGEGALWVTGSMGASAVLVFAMPHGVLSQPWSVIGGQTISAAFGVACLIWMPPGPWVAALAVGGSIALMMYARCLHPPGGATAMIAVLGGPAIVSDGFSFVLYPILLDSVVIIAAAMLFNGLFAWRRYPLGLASFQVTRTPGIAPEDFHYALKQMNSFKDIEFDDLLKVMELASKHARADSLDERDLFEDAFYSNGLPGENWSVRQLTQIVHTRPGRAGRVRYRIVKGKGEGGNGIAKTSEFLRWARYQVEKTDDGWHRINQTAPAGQASTKA